VNKADVSTALSELDDQARILACDLGNFIEHGRRQKGIVPGTQQERRPSNASQKMQRARTGVVVVRVPESVNRTGNGVVEVVKRTCSVQSNGIEEFRISLELCLRLSS